MKYSRTPVSSLSTCGDIRRRIGDGYASTTVVSPRGTNRSSGLTAWLADTWVNPTSRAIAASRCSCSGYFHACISTMAQALMPEACAAASFMPHRGFIQALDLLAIRRQRGR